MRVDKFLKVSRVIKRRTVANEVCSSGRVLINGKAAKPGTNVKIGDVLEIAFGNGTTKLRVLNVAKTVKKDDALHMYEIL